MFKLVNGIKVNLTSEEIAARQAEETAWNNGAFDRAMQQLRTKRNRLIAETDFYALSDVTMTDNMKAYRQELRDITDSATSLEDVTWPTKPS